MILLAESANKTKKGSQDLIGGLGVRVNRNYFGRQIESFEAPLHLPFLDEVKDSSNAERNPLRPFNGIFIRAPVVEKILPLVQGEQIEEAEEEKMVIAPSRSPEAYLQMQHPVKVMATLPGRSRDLKQKLEALGLDNEIGDIVAVKQDNVFGTSFHPELTQDTRIHVWWLRQVKYYYDNTQL